jgi:hypothetical protein
MEIKLLNPNFQLLNPKTGGYTPKHKSLVSNTEIKRRNWASSLLCAINHQMAIFLEEFWKLLTTLKLKLLQKLPIIEYLYGIEIHKCPKKVRKGYSALGSIS